MTRGKIRWMDRAGIETARDDRDQGPRDASPERKSDRLSAVDDDLFETNTGIR